MNYGKTRNTATPEGREMGAHLERFYEQERVKALAKWPEMPDRCKTCAFRVGGHVASGSPETLLTALACVFSGTEFFCHEPDRKGDLCAGWSTFMIAKEDSKFMDIETAERATGVKL